MTCARLPPFFLLVPALLVAVGVIIPLLYLVIRAFEVDAQTLYTIVFRQRHLELLANTLGLTLGVLIFDLILALPLAWIFSRTNFASMRSLALIGALPLAVPAYVMAYALLGLGGTDGMLAQFTGTPIPRISGYFGALLALGLTTFPYLYLNLLAAMNKLDPSLEEAARSLGHHPAVIFVRVVLPQLKPAFLAGGLLVVLHVLGDFGTVSLMRYETFSYAVYLQYAAAFDRTYAAWLALWLLVITGTFLFLESRMLGNARILRTAARPSRHYTLLQLRWTAPWVFIFVAAVGLAGIGAPLASALYWLYQGPNPLDGLMEAGGALIQSVSASLPAALLATLLAFPVAYLSTRYPSPPTRLLERIAYFGYATPPIAFALAFVFFSLWAVPFLYQTLLLLVIAYALHFMAEAIGPIRSVLHQTPVRLEESARTLGRTPWGVLRGVVIPILRPGLIAAVAFVFMSAMKELPLTFVLSPIGFDTLATNIWMYTSEAMFAQAAPHVLIIIVVSAVFVRFILSWKEKVS